MEAEDIITMVEGLSQEDFEKAPSVVFIAKLRDELRLRGVSRADAEEIVLNMGVELGNNEFTTSQMNRLVDAFAKLIVKADEALKSKGFGTDAIKKIASRFTLKLA